MLQAGLLQFAVTQSGSFCLGCPQAMLQARLPTHVNHEGKQERGRGGRGGLKARLPELPGDSYLMYTRRMKSADPTSTSS